MIDDLYPTADKDGLITALNVPDTQVSPVFGAVILLGNSETRVDLHIVSPGDARSGSVFYGFSDVAQNLALFQDHAASPYIVVAGLAVNEILSNITASSRYMVLRWAGIDPGSITVVANITKVRR